MPTPPAASQAASPSASPRAGTQSGRFYVDPTARPTPAKPPPKRERSTGLAWLSLVLCVLGVSAPLLLRIGEPGVLPGGEAEALATLEATQRERFAAGAEWSTGVWTPVVAGEVRYDRPPGALWLQLVSLSGLDPEAMTREDLKRRARLATAAMLLLAVVGTFWSAHAIGGTLPATLAALSLGSMPLWLVWGRAAEPAIMATGWMMMSVGAGLWATRPLRPPATVLRQVVGWTLCGVFLAGAVLTGGLRMLPPSLAPLVVVLFVAPHRVGHALGLVTALVVAGLCVTPWALYVHEHDAHAWGRWWTDLAPTRWDQPVDYGRLMAVRAGVLAAMLLPWLVWVAAGLLQTFSTSTGGARLRMLIGWVWFVSVSTMLIASPGDRAYQPLVLAVPAGAVVVGQAFRRFSELASGGRFPRLWRWVSWPHLAVLGVLSAALPAAAVFQLDLARLGWLDRPWVAPMPWQYWAAAAAALAALVVWSGRTAWKREPARCGVLWAVWGIVMAAVLAGPVARGPLAHDRYAEAAAELMRMGRGGAVVQAADAPLPSRQAATMRFHTGRDLVEVGRARLLDRGDADAPGDETVLAPLDAPTPDPRWRAYPLRGVPLAAWRWEPDADATPEP